MPPPLRAQVETWTDMNVVVYTGSAEDRAECYAHEFFSRNGRVTTTKFDVLITTYETRARPAPPPHCPRFGAMRAGAAAAQCATTRRCGT